MAGELTSPAQHDDETRANGDTSVGRLWGLREAFDWIERFRVLATSCEDFTALQEAFRKDLTFLLSGLRVTVYSIDFLLINDTEFELVAGTEPTHLYCFPGMTLDAPDNRAPTPEAGAAATCVWAYASYKKRVAVAVPTIVNPKRHANGVLYLESDDPAERPKWKGTEVSRVFTPCVQTAEFRSILCVPVTMMEGQTGEAHAPGGISQQLTCIGALCLARRTPSVFDDSDIEWAWTCGAFVGGLYASYVRNAKLLFDVTVTLGDAIAVLRPSSTPPPVESIHSPRTEPVPNAPPTLASKSGERKRPYQQSTDYRGKGVAKGSKSRG